MLYHKYIAIINCNKERDVDNLIIIDFQNSINCFITNFLFLYISWKNACAIWFIRLMKLYYDGNIPFPIFAPLTFYHFAWIWRLIVLYEGKLIIIIQRTATKRKNDVKDQTIQKEEHKSISIFEKFLYNTLQHFRLIFLCKRLFTINHCVMHFITKP